MAAAELDTADESWWHSTQYPASAEGDELTRPRAGPRIRGIITRRSATDSSPVARQVTNFRKHVLTYVRIPARLSEEAIVEQIILMNSRPARAKSLGREFTAADGIDEARRNFQRIVSADGSIAEAREWLLREFKNVQTSERLRERTRQNQVDYAASATARGNFDGALGLQLFDSYTWEELIRKLVLNTLIPNALEEIHRAQGRKALNAAAVHGRAPLLALMGPAELMFLWRERLVLWLEVAAAERATDIYKQRVWNHPEGRPFQFLQTAESLAAAVESVRRSALELDPGLRSKLAEPASSDEFAKSLAREIFQGLFRQEEWEA